MLLRRGFSLASYVNCAFDPLSYRKHVLACWQWNRIFGAFCYKKTAILFFVSGYPLSSLIVAKIRFCMLATKSCSFEFYAIKKAFLLSRCLIAPKKGLLPVAASQPDFHLILLKQRFCFLLAELRCLRIVFLRTALFSVSVTKLHSGRSILPEKCFCFLAT